MGQKRAYLIGNGTMGKRHRARFEECGVFFDKLLDVDAAEWIFSEGEDVLKGKDARPDFVVIASPASTHYQYAKFFLERSIPVLVEKPLAATPSQAMELVELSKARNTLLFVAQSECYNPLFLNFRKHFLVDLENAVAASRASAEQSENAGYLPLDVKLEFRREHGYSERCRDVDVSLDLLIHDVSLFLTMFRYEDVMVVRERECGCGNQDESHCGCGNHETACGDKARLTLKVVSGKYAGVEASFLADRDSEHDVRNISVEFGRNGRMSGFEYSVSLARYMPSGEVAHIPDSLDNEHRFFLKLLGGGYNDWAKRAMENAAQSIVLMKKC